MNHIITAAHIIPAMRTALRADTYFSSLSTVPTIVCGHSGTFDEENLPKPAVVLAPESERNPYPPVTRNAQKLVRVTVHAYTQFFGAEIGMLGDSHALGVMELVDALETFFDDNTLAAYLSEYAGWIARAHVLDKIYPDPLNMNYVDLNEARLTVEYLTINPALV